MGLEMISFIIVSIVLAIVQIGMFFSFPYSVRAVMCGIPVLSVALNWAASSVILLFTGAGTFVGIANMAASLIFAVQLLLYKAIKGIKEIKLVIKGLKPKIVVVYFNGEEE